MLYDFSCWSRAIYGYQILFEVLYTTTFLTQELLGFGAQITSVKPEAQQLECQDTTRLAWVRAVDLNSTGALRFAVFYNSSEYRSS